MIIKENLKKIVAEPKDVSQIFKNILKMEGKIDQEKEHFWVIGLSSRNNIKYIELVSLGTLNANLVHPRETFRLAIYKGVAQIIVAHNHPSGDPEPSEDDMDITIRLRKAGEILGIKVIDHIIISKQDYFSFADKGLIKKGGDKDGY